MRPSEIRIVACQSEENARDILATRDHAARIFILAGMDEHGKRRESRMSSNKVMDRQLIQPFINAMVNVLQTMAFTEVQSLDPYVKEDKRARGDVSGVIGIAGDWMGSLAISFSKASILTIVSNMFSVEMTEIDDEIQDAVGEITNMVSGQARQELQGIGVSLESSIPTVISGGNHSIKHITSYPSMAVPFSLSNGGEFTVEICLEKKTI